MIKARKSLGQNFLIDRSVSRRIIESVAPQTSDLIIEIGPGVGALTEMLARQSGYVAAIEIDDRLVEELRAKIAAPNLAVIKADALGIDWIDLISSARAAMRELTGADAARVRVVANLPYYISTAIIERMIGLGGLLHDMTLMLQDEVVERIASGPGTKDYGYLSVLVQFYCEARKLFTVPPDAFKPAPRVNSAVVRLAVRGEPVARVADARRFFAVVKAAFAQRRKTILNNLKAAAPALGIEGPVAEAIERAGIDPRRRAETLTVEEFASLHGALSRE